MWDLTKRRTANHTPPHMLVCTLQGHAVAEQDQAPTLQRACVLVKQAIMGNGPTLSNIDTGESRGGLQPVDTMRHRKGCVPRTSRNKARPPLVGLPLQLLNGLPPTGCLPCCLCSQRLAPAHELP